MSERRQLRWSWWVRTGALAMAALAVLALGVTVRIAQHALDNAGDVVIRGDADALVAGLVVELSDAEWPVTSEILTRVVARHQAQRLRYVALVDQQSDQVRVAAGEALIAKPFDLPGEVARQGQRVRLIDALARLYARTEGRRDVTELTGLPLDQSTPARARGETENNPDPRAYLVVEFEPPVIERLENDLTLIWIVAALAALVLIAFAFAWRRSFCHLLGRRHAPGLAGRRLGVERGQLGAIDFEPGAQLLTSCSRVSPPSPSRSANRAF